MSKKIKEHYRELVSSCFLGFSETDFKVEKRRAWSTYKRFAPKDHDALILDVGCGAGHLLGALADRGYRRLVGLDISPDQIELCRKRLPGVEVHVADALEFIAHHSQKFDCIFLTHVIEHLELDDAVGLLRAIRQRLATNGHLVLATPNASFPWASYHLYHDLTHKRLYDTESCVQLFRLAGFSDVVLSPDNPSPFDLSSTLRWLAWIPRSLWLKFMFLVDVGPGRTGKRKIIVSPGIIAVARP